MKSKLRLEVEEYERGILVDTLKRNEGIVSRCSQELGMFSSNFYALVRKYNINLDDFRKVTNGTNHEGT